MVLVLLEDKVRNIKSDRKRLSKQPHERNYMAKKCREFLRAKSVEDKLNILTLNSITKLVRYYLKNYKKV